MESSPTLSARMLTRLTEAITAHPPEPRVHALMLLAVADLYAALPKKTRKKMPEGLQQICEATLNTIAVIEKKERRNDG